MAAIAHRRRVPDLALVLATLVIIFGPWVAYEAVAGGDPHAMPVANDDHEEKHDDKKHDAKNHDDKKHDAEHGMHKEPSALEHVMDSPEIHLFSTFWPQHIPLPSIFGLQITKFMFLELLAAGLIIVIYVPLARRLKSGEPARGAIANSFEVLLTFVRNEIAKPSIGEDQADRYVPFLWTLFLFILFNNLLGMFPFMGSATASLYVTAALALIVFFAIHGSAILKMGAAADDGHNGHGHDSHGHAHGESDHGHGDTASAPASLAQILQKGPARYVKSLWPNFDVPIPVAGFIIKVVVCVIEIIGILARNGVLAVRLFANMFAGHMVLATILLFIQITANAHWALWGTVTVSSVLGILALSLLELFVACLQAYIFTFLTALFMGMAINPQH